jgi:hypothetical protein
MQVHVLEIISTALQADNTVSPAERKIFLRQLRGEPVPAPDGKSNSHEPRIYSRTGAAKLLGDKSCRYIDLLCRRGLLEKFTPKGNQRSIGVTAESLNRFLEGGGK